MISSVLNPVSESQRKDNISKLFRALDQIRKDETKKAIFLELLEKAREENSQYL